MAIKIDKDKLPEKSQSNNKETKVIPSGAQVARFVSYVEMGKHQPMFKGKPAVFDSGKRAGQQKEPETIIQLVFEFTAAEYTGDYPLTICTSIPWESEFINKLAIPESLLNGTLSRQFAMKSGFMKYLEALKDATGDHHQNMDAYIGAPLLINVTHRQGKADDKGVIPVYAQMKPEGINKPEWRHPLSGKVEMLEVPPSKGTYCSVYDWDAPTPEGWKLLMPSVQKAIKSALNFDGSPTQLMLAGMPEEDTNVKDEKAVDKTPPENTGKPVSAPESMAPNV